MPDESIFLLLLLISGFGVWGWVEYDEHKYKKRRDKEDLEIRKPRVFIKDTDSNTRDMMKRIMK